MRNIKQNNNIVFKIIVGIIVIGSILIVAYVDNNTQQIENDYCKQTHDSTFCNYR